MKKIILNLVKILIAAAAIYFLITKIGLNEIISAIQTIPLLFVVLALISHSAYLVVGGINIQPFTNPLNKKLTIWESIKYYALSWSWGMFIPGKIGDFSLIYYLKKHKFSYSEGLTISLLLKLGSFFFLGIFAIIGSFWFFEKNIAMLISAIYILGYFLIILILIWKKTYIFTNKIFKKFSKHTKTFRKDLISVLKNKKSLSFGFLLTLGRWIVDSITNYIIFWGLGVNISLEQIIIVNAIATLIAMIPISISGLGLREGSKTYLYTLLGVPAGLAAGAAIIYIILLYVYAFAILIFTKVSKKVTA